MQSKPKARGRREKFYVFYDENDFVKYCGTAKQLADDGVFKKPDYVIQIACRINKGKHIQKITIEPVFDDAECVEI